MLRPAAATDLWRQRASGESFEAHADAALSSIAMIEAANAEDEALAIAVALREALENGKTAALITPDRALGARVKAALQRWQIVAEDTGGVALSETPAGIFARLAAEAALGELAPVTLLGLLKHPLLRLGARDNARAVAALERAVLRGPRPRAGSAGLLRALDAFIARLEKHRSKKGESDLHGSDPRTRLFAEELAAAADLVRALAAAVAPLETIGTEEHSLADLAARHREVLAALSREGAAERAFLGPDGTKLADALDELAASEAAGGVAVAPSDYVELFSALLADRVVRAPPLAGARVRILGLLEARLTANDLVVLGGLVEGAWPPESRTDAWLSRPMRLELGLDLPERRIGLSAHDFAQMLGAPEVILTRAAKVGGAPTQASRFIQRLAAIAGEARWQAALDRGNVYLRWARSLDQPASVKAEPRPEPKPPRAVAAEALVRHRDRALAARSLHDLRQACAPAQPARRGRCAARRRRARHRDPQCAARIQRALRRARCPPIRPAC